MLKYLLLFCLLSGSSLAQDYQDYQENTPRPAPLRLRQHSAVQEAPRPTPVPILKQINKHNEDGSYTYGYEGADGSFKIETKLATGEVKGKYGYVDETGKVRVVEYGANKYGFQPSGEGITVAPPTLVDESTRDEPEYEDEPIRPQRPYKIPRPQKQTRPAPPPPPRPQPQYIQYEEEEIDEPQHQPQPIPQQLPRRPQYVPQSAPAPAPPRLQIPGAQRSTDVVYSSPPRASRPEHEYSQTTSFGEGGSNFRLSRPSYAPAPVNPAPSSARAQGFLAPASGGRPILEPVGYAPSPSPAPAPAPRPIQPQIQSQQPRYQPQIQGRSGGGGGGGSLLDQLARDYALPQGNAQPLHDISFGYY